MRIEQNADGTYGKRMTSVEQKTLNLIYTEQNNRTAADAALQVQLNEANAQLIVANNDIAALKTKLNQAAATQAANEENIVLLQTQLQQLKSLLQQKGVI